MNKKILAALVGITILAGCDNDAMVVSHNLSRAADNFEIPRRVVFYNGITDAYILTVEGLCSITADSADRQLEVTCKVGRNGYKKHFLGISDNVTYFVEQLDSANASAHSYRVTFKPEVILPSVDVRTSVGNFNASSNF